MKRRARPGEAWPTFLALAALETDECVEWPFGRKSFGYGKVKIPGDREASPTHRLALHRREPCPDPKFVACHGPCHNPVCMNYRHLYWASEATNQADRFRDGTHTRGAKNAQARLGEGQVIQIRHLCGAGVLPQWRIAKHFGISQASVSRIHQGDCWGWL